MKYVLVEEEALDDMLAAVVKAKQGTKDDWEAYLYTSGGTIRGLMAGPKFEDPEVVIKPQVGKARCLLCGGDKEYKVLLPSGARICVECSKGLEVKP